MLPSLRVGLAFASIVLSSPILAANFAESIVRYESGSGFATEFGSGAGYTNALAALGEPSRVTPGQFGGPVDPFSPPFLRDQLVSVGAGGSLTVRFAAPVPNDPTHPFGLDFLIFGNAGFVITNGNFSGGGITDGALFSANAGATRVWVSADNTNYFLLNPSRAPGVDGYYPTDGTGDFSLPVNPKFGAAHFSGRDLSNLRALYDGSGGGTGFDIGWAQDAAGKPVTLDRIQFVRVEVISGASEIDAFSAVAPRQTRRITEEFASDPAARGWKIFGDTSLFRWNATNQLLDVTWDSGRSNSYFYLPLGTILTKDDDFSMSFDLRMREIKAGVRPGHPFAFQLAMGLLHLRDATNATFLRGTGTQSPNLVEFNYFPDTGFGATLSPVIVTTNSQFFPSFSFPLELTPGDAFRVTLSYSATNKVLSTLMTRNGAAFGPVKDVILPANFTDFRVDTLAISSYSDTGADGSILAQGGIDNIVLTIPAPPVQDLVAAVLDGRGQVEFTARSHWNYTLERTSDFRTWTPVATVRATSAGRQTLRDNSPAAAAQSFYRVRAER